MVRDDVCWLIKEIQGAHGAFDAPQRVERMVYCQAKSVRASEFWTAMTAGSELAAVFVLSDYHEYDGERLLRWDGRLYKVARSYVTGQAIELTCEEADAYDTDA